MSVEAAHFEKKRHQAVWLLLALPKFFDEEAMHLVSFQVDQKTIAPDNT
jgi:hypothetical protein